MNKPSIFTLLIPVGTLLASCATNSGGQQSEPVKHKKSHTSSSTLAPSSKSIAKIPAKKTVAPDTEYSLFYSRLAIPEKDYTERDRQIFMAFPPAPAAGTIHEAALVVGILRDIVTPIGGMKNTFKEVDITADQANKKSGTAVIAPTAPTPERSNIMEARCREKGVDCISAFASNPHLQNHAIYNMAWDASRQPGNSPLFLQNLGTVLKSELEAWGELARKMGLDVQPVTPTTTNATPAVAAEGTGINPDAASDKKPDTALAPEGLTANLGEADNAAAAQTIAKAMEFAGKDDYEKAIAEARKVPQGAESYLAAQENIKNWANKAVQDLRRQAANQYRSSSSTNEASGKKAFLGKARAHLQNALTKYPEASTLDTVKENLEIINKELERLQ